jgi:hypothetical protein
MFPLHKVAVVVGVRAYSAPYRTLSCTVTDLETVEADLKKSGFSKVVMVTEKEKTASG